MAVARQQATNTARNACSAPPPTRPPHLRQVWEEVGHVGDAADVKALAHRLVHCTSGAGSAQQRMRLRNAPVTAALRPQHRRRPAAQRVTHAGSWCCAGGRSACRSPAWQSAWRRRPAHRWLHRHGVQAGQAAQNGCIEACTLQATAAAAHDGPRPGQAQHSTARVPSRAQLAALTHQLRQLQLARPRVRVDLLHLERLSSA